jgi:MFS family permease
MSTIRSALPTDARRLVLARSLRGFVDGAVSVLLASYLTALGFSATRIGALATGTLLGSAALTLLVGLGAGHRERRTLLLAASGLMFATGVGFASVTAFVPLLAVAVIGTLNPSSGDVSVFLPTEQAALADAVGAAERTAAFATYNVAGNVAGALGALASGIPVALAIRYRWDLLVAQRSVFWIYSAAAIVCALVYLGLTRRYGAAPPAARPLARSRPIVLKLAALFCVDSFGGGFVIQALVALWLYRRFQLSVEVAATFFFLTNLVAAGSQLVAPQLAARFGLIRTMVFTHLPGNLFLAAAAFMPTAPLAMLCLFLRSCVSQMDVPARQSFVMSVVPPEERAAAASVTNVPRSLAAAGAPVLAGWLLDRSTFGWPLVLAGALKTAYDLALFGVFRSTKPADTK